MNIFADESSRKSENILDRIQDFLFPGELEIEGSGYERSILDRRIEKYLDEHFDEYISEFGLVRELEIEVLGSNYVAMVKDIEDIEEFQLDVESELSSLRRRVEKLED